MKTLTLTQAQTLGSLEPKDIAKVYSGRPNSWGNHCRCGCQGIYRYSSDIDINKDRGYAGDPEETSDRFVAKALKIVQDNVTLVRVGDDSDDANWYDVELPSGRCYTIYLKGGR